MWIKINEREYELATGSTLDQLRQKVKPEADLLIVNGFPASPDAALQEGDRVVLIQRGEIPVEDELDALLTARHTPGVHEKVRSACVGIAGVGGLGSAVAVALTRIGIGQLIIADFDIVEPSNLNRQQFFLDQIGLPKVYALRDTLARINPHVHVTACHLKLTPGNLAELFTPVQVLVEAFDKADQKVMLIEEFASRFPEKPIVAGSGMAGYGPSNTIGTERCGSQLFVCGDGTTAAEPGTGLMAPRVGIAAHHQANAVLRLLLGLEPSNGAIETACKLS
ncbi:MAG: sulfur carrier protein ThiS adenylyltransferase ThiF [Desulfuromonadales bacterium]|nr:sulfur carrier protein ThiS adenylyltransferase ThiF [Desulfuromonadales bacterium]